MKAEDNKLILLVDDTPNNIQVLGTMLGITGYEISVATSGRQALSIIDKRIPDLILLDVMMPKMDGFSVCKKIKSNPATSNIPVIFISAKNDTESKLKGFEVGGADYIIKPFQSAEVMARVRTHLALKDAMQTINKHNVQLEQMLEVKTRELIKTERHAAFSLLIQGIVHNLKNPLAGVSGGAQMILMNRDSMKDSTISIPENLKNIFEKNYKYADMILRSSEKLITMIDSLMVKGKSDKAGRMEIINLNDIVKQEINFLGADYRFKHHIKKTIRLFEEELMLEIVPSELSQVIENLIGNSIDAMHNQHGAELIIETGRDNQIIRFSIGDNGPGIPKNIQSKIFNPFFSTKPKTNSTGNNKPVGTGLGLYTCSEIVNSYNGKIEIISEDNKGTTIEVSLPVSQDQ